METLKSLYNRSVQTMTWSKGDGGDASASQFVKKGLTTEAQMARSAVPTAEWRCFMNSGSSFVRLAGVSGALAVAMAAYGAHTLSTGDPELKRVYETANFHHFVHTLALLAVPLTRKPHLSGTLIIMGMALFCGTTYYHAMTGERALRRYTPFGGIILITAWLSMAL